MIKKEEGRERSINYLYSCPDSKCKGKPIGEREEPSVNNPSNEDESNEEWNLGLLLHHMVQQVHCSLFQVNGNEPFLTTTTTTTTHCSEEKKEKEKQTFLFPILFLDNSVCYISMERNL